MSINQANINNLKSLWKKYGAHKLLQNNSPMLHVNTHWPYRCWFDNTVPFTNMSLLQNVLQNLPESTIYPIWPSLRFTTDSQSKQRPDEQGEIEKHITNQHWFCLFEQTAMYLTLTNEISTVLSSQIKPRAGFTMTKVRTADDITLWVNIVADSFGYTVDRVVIEKLINDQDMQILMANYNNQAIATAILFKTGDVIGVHQVGVKKSFQGKGFARILMQELITMSLLWQGKLIVLQASAAGKPLYESLGFTSQFLIKNYKRSTLNYTTQ